MPKILCVDDDLDLLDLISSTFEDDGHSVTRANSGNSASELVEKNDFDVIVSDAKMPNGTGVDLLKFVHNLNKKKKPIFFLLTGYTDHNEEELKEYGCQAILLKPHDVINVVEIVNKVLEES